MKKTKQVVAVMLTVIMLASTFAFTSSAATLVWPVPGHTNLSQGFHDGKAIDISDGNIAGAPVVAAMSGTVTHIFLCGEQHYGSSHDCNGFGTGLVILGDDGRYYQYAHMQANSIPTNAYRTCYVSAGQMIGRVGTTGNSSGYHLHFGISTGNYWNESGINPKNETYTYINPLGSVDLGSDFYAFIIQMSAWKHLEEQNSNVQIASNGNNSKDPKQIWHFLRQSDGSYKIVSEYDGKCLDLYDASPADTTNVWTYQDNGTNAQRWFIFNSGDGYGIRTACGYAVLDCTGGSVKPGTNIQIYSPNGTIAQIFSVYDLRSDGVTYSKPSKPAASTISVSSLGQPNQTTTLSWTQSALKSSNFDSRSYTLILTKDGAAYQTKTGLTGTSINLTLPKGTYTAKIRAINTKYYNYYTDGNTITFTVKDCTHSWNSGVVTTPATCTATGVKTFTCTSCGATRTETIGKTSHTVTLINQRDATYDAEGYTGDEYCTTCKQTIHTGTAIPKLEKPADPTPSDPQPAGDCRWCGGNHNGFFGWFIRIFHNLFAAIFGPKN